MDGIINLNKPVGITSAKALYRVRAITRQRKSGHAGTLDPAARGVLILCLGKGTKLVERFMDLPKVYRATARLDVTSESFDSDRPLRPVAVNAPPSLEELIDGFRSLEGTIEQVPPAISAIKVGGVPAYKRSRGGVAVELRPRPVTVYWIHVYASDWPTVDFEMCCGRGTYVRAVIRDLGERLQTGGCLTSLQRSQIGPFKIQSAWTFEALAAESDALRYVMPIEEVLEMLSSAGAGIPSRPAERRG